MPRIALLAVLALFAGCSPQSYEDCVLEHMDGVASDIGARVVMHACREKHPIPPVVQETSDGIINPWAGMDLTKHSEAQDGSQKEELVGRMDGKLHRYDESTRTWQPVDESQYRFVEGEGRWAKIR